MHKSRVLDLLPEMILPQSQRAPPRRPPMRRDHRCAMGKWQLRLAQVRPKDEDGEKAPLVLVDVVTGLCGGEQK